MNYTVLFEIRITHEYCADQPCSDFAIEPTPATQRLLDNHRCLLRWTTDGIRVLTAATDEGEPFIPLFDDARINFYLKLLNRDFLIYTDLSGIPVGEFPLFTNTKGLIQPTSRTEEKKSPRDRFAEIEIRCSEFFETPARGAVGLCLSFKAKSIHWHYYLVTDKNGAEFDIQDKESSLKFSEKFKRDLNESPDAEDPIAVSLADLYPTMKRIRFGSTKPITCRRKPVQTIQLVLGSDQVLDTLPNPSWQNFSSVKIKGTRGSRLENSLFQVIKYVTPKK